MRAHFPDLPLVIDAGLGLPSQAAHAMELGYDAVLLNTAVAKAGHPAAMAEGFARALEAGRLGYQGRPDGGARHGRALDPGSGEGVHLMTLPRFYPIFDDADWLRRTLPFGVKLVQLRIKELTGEALTGQIAQAQALCRAHSATLVVNDHWQAAIDLGCDWVHLGQEDLDTADIPAIRQAGIKIGVSTHDHAELDRALSHDPDYVALGPVYPTILKKMKWHEQGLDRLTEWKRLIGDIPLVAIGGMSVERAPGAFDAGADVVSAVTDITLNPDPEARVRQWIEATR